MPTNTDDSTLVRLLNRVAEVCPIPATAQRVMLLSAIDECDIRDVAEAIAADPALAAQTMRIANSAVYRRRRAVETLGQAIMMLGLTQIHDMAAAMAMMAAFQTEHELSLQFHSSSVLSGTIAGLLAAEFRVADRAPAFLTGLLSEVGAMACVAVDGKGFSKIYQQAAGDWTARAELETERYTVPSWEIGAQLLDRNQLPDVLCRAVGAHFDLEQDELDGLAQVTVFGRVAAPEIAAHSDEEPLSELGPRLAEIAVQCGLDEATEEQLVELTERAVSSAEAALSKQS